LIHARALDDVDIMVVTLNLYRYCEVRLVENLKKSADARLGVREEVTNLEGAMHQGFIKVKNKTLFALEFRCLRR
jgi:hypothetical protein